MKTRFISLCAVLALLASLGLAAPVFAQQVGAPDVSTAAATSITATSAVLNGNLVSLGVATSANVSFEWGTTSGALSANTSVETVTSTGLFDAPLDMLSANTTYYFRARAVSDNGSALGDEMSFTTARILAVTATGDKINENSVATVGGTLAYFGPAANVTLTVNWGDGSSPGNAVYPATAKVYAQTHLYLDDDPTGTGSDNFSVLVSVTDGQGNSATATANVTVVNVPPTVNAGPDRAIASGDNLSILATFTDPGTLDTHTAEINWGDGTSSAGVVSEVAGSGNVTGTHMYLDAPATYKVVVIVTDDDGGQGSDSFELTVNRMGVTIDIKPGSATNPINLRSEGVIPVAILGSGSFDATKVDAETVRFGPDGAAPVHFGLEDVNGDNMTDMVLQFRTQDCGFSDNDTSATLIGRTVGGVNFTGTDSIRIVPPEKGKGQATGKGGAPGQNKEPGGPAEGKGGGRDEAPGQNKEPGEPAQGKAVGNDEAPGQNKEAGQPAQGKGLGKDEAPGQQKK